ncbi:MAG: quinol dehydrogenase ferredoxin subunit NapH [Burkholderiaceae bacterium]|nr:quinol dehydrogenase ferredoxin subunit NapH [Burkholderiaceae bacterium]MBP7659123.1 quinol dehydrogenase ferredoxin subunit NapH [Burkholderiaceae bacterium]
MSAVLDPGRDAVLQKGRWAANRWLVLRRASQFGLLGLFLLGPWAGVWFVKGNLASSMTLGVLPLTDPFVLLQTLAARHWPQASALVGVLVVLLGYAVLGGRVFCSWVCPMNLVTDAAAFTRRRLGLRGSRSPSRNTRLWLLGAVMAVAAITGVVAWEFVNPVTTWHRTLVFGGLAGWLLAGGIFVYDTAVAHHGWCGHVCPQGALYGLIGKASLLRVSAARRSQCNDCGDCLVICPETPVIAPALKGKGSPVILASDCTNCGRCIDVCSRDVFRFTTRFDQRSPS